MILQSADYNVLSNSCLICLLIFILVEREQHRCQGFQLCKWYFIEKSFWLMGFYTTHYHVEQCVWAVQFICQKQFQ